MKGYLKVSGSLLNKNATALSCLAVLLILTVTCRLICNPLYIEWHKKADWKQPAGFISSEAI